jgi:YtkA-like
VLMASLGRQMVVPSSAVLYSGLHTLIFLNRGGGQLEPHEVEGGPTVGQQTIILKGLKSGDSIVTSANFLIDSESQLQAAASAYSATGVAPEPTGSAPGTLANQANIDFKTDPSPPRKGGNTFRVRLTTAEGKPIEGAQVAVTLFMPAMPAMGMAAMRTVVSCSDKGNGRYEGSGTLGSGGTWQVTITAQQNGKSIASKSLTLSAEGGM